MAPYSVLRVQKLEHILWGYGEVMETFVQKECDGKGNEVEVIREHRNLITLRNIKTGFIYFVSLRNFQKKYEAKNVEN